MRPTALAALLLLSACGKPLLYAEVEIPKATITVPQQAFPFVDLPLPGVPPVDGCTPDPDRNPANACLQQTIEYDLGSDFRDLVKDAERFDLRLTRLGIVLAPTAGFPDFGSVVRVRVLAEWRDASRPPLELASYTRDPAVPHPASIDVGARSTVNIGDYVQGGFIRINAEMEFDQSIPGFTADVSGEFYLKVLVDWGKKAGVF